MGRGEGEGRGEKSERRFSYFQCFNFSRYLRTAVCKLFVILRSTLFAFSTNAVLLLIPSEKRDARRTKDSRLS